MGESVTSHRPWWREWSTSDWITAVALAVAGFMLHAILTPWLWRVIVVGVFVAYPGRVWWRRRSERRGGRNAGPMPPEYGAPADGGSPQ